MARFSLSFLLLLSIFSLSLARFVPEPDNLLQRPGTESEPSFLPQLPKPEFESESESETATLPELPNPDQEEKFEIPELSNPEPVEKPEIAETVQYIVVPVHRFNDVRDFEHLRDIGFSLRLPMRHGHRHHRHHFGGFGHRFGHRFRHGFAGRGRQMEGHLGLLNGAEGRNMEMPEMEMHEKFVNYDKTEVPMEGEEKMERAKEIMKRMRKCKHHHMEKGMMHRHHEHHHPEPREEPREEPRMEMHRHHEHHHPEPREEPREQREEDGFIKQLWNLFNF
ncbi:hypothetical protein FCM35_KLT00921 [Carex littledalei]|uniref:Uncharacterized protein n=1 Tax=Carex littledalei TaxID=544730 RepID=A0A833QT62_9POAL|nr:hypothetical protein FCM35_KLT00921 [Carex littledalei]